MLTWLRRFRLITVGDVGWWHGRRGYPRQIHGIALPLLGPAQLPATREHDGGDNVTPFRSTGETGHG